MTVLPRDNTIGLGMFCGAKYTHDTFAGKGENRIFRAVRDAIASEPIQGAPIPPKVHPQKYFLPILLLVFC